MPGGRGHWRKPISIRWVREDDHVSINIKSTWLVLALGFIVALGLAEIGARIWLGYGSSLNSDNKVSGAELFEEPGIRYNSICPKMCLDTYLGYVLCPDTNGNGYHTNKAGFRDPNEISKSTRKQEISIFITGASAAWGAGAPNHDLTIGALLEKKLNAIQNIKPYKVVNAAVPGYCLTQERILLENRLLDYNPALVIMFTGYNELAYAFSGVDTLHIQDHFTWRSRTDGFIRTADGALIPSKPLPTDYRLKIEYLLRNFLWNATVGNRRNQIWTYSEQRIALPLTRFKEIIKRNLEIVGALSRQQGFQVIVALQPSLFSTKKKFLPIEKQALKAAQSRQGFESFMTEYTPALHDVMKTTAQSQGLGFISLLDIFDGADAAIFYDECHFGGRGARLVAEKLAMVVGEERQR